MRLNNVNNDPLCRSPFDMAHLLWLFPSIFLCLSLQRSKVVQSSPESGRKYWAIRSSPRSFARTAHSLVPEFLGSLIRGLKTTRFYSTASSVYLSHPLFTSPLFSLSPCFYPSLSLSLVFYLFPVNTLDSSCCLISIILQRRLLVIQR